MKNDWENRNVLVLGLGDSGLSALRWLAPRGARIRAADSRPAPPSMAAIRQAHPGIPLALGNFENTLLEGVDAVVASPGIALREPILREAARRGIEILGDVEIFARAVAEVAPGARVIGITGTNGKSTVTALAGAMGTCAGLRTTVAGNIGVPVLDALGSEDAARADLFVLELSSYQLETTASLRLAAATLLNLTQDHMDRYDSMEDYARAKERIFADAQVRVVNRDDAWSRRAATGSPRELSFGLGVPRSDREWGVDETGRELRRGDYSLLRIEEMALKGQHNVSNALAAHALLSAIGAAPEALAKAIREFRGLPHRMEPVAEIHGVSFLDDSKGTNVGSTVAALDGMDRPVVLIAGGDGKGQDFAPLVPAVARRARAVVLIGRDAGVLDAALAPTPVQRHRANSMEEAVELAFELARSGDAVLLSPACASLDMFRNYGHRGEVFAEAVRSIAARSLH